MTRYISVDVADACWLRGGAVRDPQPCDANRSTLLLQELQLTFAAVKNVLTPYAMPIMKKRTCDQRMRSTSGARHCSLTMKFSFVPRTL